MTEIEFVSSMDRLKNYLRVSLDKSDYETYFRRFSRTPIDIFSVVIDWLIDHHERRSFPLMTDFKSALDEVLSKHNAAIASDLDDIVCPRCNNYGRYVNAEFTFSGGIPNKETFCSCRHGQAAKAARLLYLKAHGRGYTSIQPRQKQREREPGEDDEAAPF